MGIHIRTRQWERCACYFVRCLCTGDLKTVFCVCVIIWCDYVRRVGTKHMPKKVQWKIYFNLSGNNSSNVCIRLNHSMRNKRCIICAYCQWHQTTGKRRKPSSVNECALVWFGVIFKFLTVHKARARARTHRHCSIATGNSEHIFVVC